MDDANNALFGSMPNTSYMPATMLNGNASSNEDWGTILAEGIRGAAVNAINGAIRGAYDSGQLQTAQPVRAPVTSSTSLLVLGALAYLLFAD